jgi:hypothetical protein
MAWVFAALWALGAIGLVAAARVVARLDAALLRARWTTDWPVLERLAWIADLERLATGLTACAVAWLGLGVLGTAWLWGLAR